VTHTTEEAAAEEEEEEETREIPIAIGIRTATETTVVANATLTEGTAGIGVNVVAHRHPAVEGIHLTGGAGATPGAPQEAAAHAGITMRPLQRRWRRRLQTPVGKSHHAARRCCKWSMGNKMDGQEVKYPSDEEVSGYVAPQVPNFLSLQNPVKNRTLFDSK
jgi:hypothetical protein